MANKQQRDPGDGERKNRDRERHSNPQRERFLLWATLLLSAANGWQLLAQRAQRVDGPECLPLRAQNAELLRRLDECTARAPTHGHSAARALSNRQSAALDLVNFPVPATDKHEHGGDHAAGARPRPLPACCTICSADRPICLYELSRGPAPCLPRLAIKPIACPHPRL
jgi:hypothetical protein